MAYLQNSANGQHHRRQSYPVTSGAHWSPSPHWQREVRGRPLRWPMASANFKLGRVEGDSDQRAGASRSCGFAITANQGWKGACSCGRTREPAIRRNVGRARTQIPESCPPNHHLEGWDVLYNIIFCYIANILLHYTNLVLI